MKKKILVFALALTLAMPVLAKTKFNPSDNENNATSFSITSVSQDSMENNSDMTVTITGSGFSTIGVLGVKLGQWTDNANDDTDDSFALTNFSLDSDTTISVTIPAGSPAENNQDITVFDSGADPNTHFTLQDAVTIHPSFQVNDQDGDNDGIVEVFQSSQSSAKAVFNLTVLGKRFKNKRWLKLKVGNKKAVITKISRSGNDTIVRAKFKYGKMAANNYNISLSYKDRLKYGVRSKNRLKYRNMRETGTMTSNNAFSVMLQPTP